MLAGALLLAAVAGLQEDGPRVLLRDRRAPPGTGTDVVFLPDGFRPGEEADFESSVRRALDLLGRQSASFVRARPRDWSFHAAFVPSAEPCPAEPGAPAGDTAFRTHLETPEGGGLFTSDDAAVAAAAARVEPGVDCVVVIVRATSELWFATGDLPFEGARVRLPEGLEELLLHELGHSLFALGDEYAGRPQPFPAHELAAVPFYPNVTLDPSGARFADANGAVPPLVEGALDFTSGIFRAAGPCVMESVGAARFCPPCARVIAAGRPSGLPEAPPALVVTPPDAPDGAWSVEVVTPAAERAAIVRRFAVLFAPGEQDDAALLAAFAAAHARVSQKTRYMESPWIGDGALARERVLSLEGHRTRIELGELTPGTHVLVVADANLLGLSPPALVRLEVQAAAVAPR